jgi:hypothetical protein
MFLFRQSELSLGQPARCFNFSGNPIQLMLYMVAGAAVNTKYSINNRFMPALIPCCAGKATRRDTRLRTWFRHAQERPLIISFQGEDRASLLSDPVAAATSFTRRQADDSVK